MGKSSPILRQDSFQGRNDSVALNSSTFTYALDTNWTQLVDDVFRVRFVIQETNATQSKVTHKWQFNIGGAGYVDVSATTAVQWALSGNYANGDATSQVIGSGSFVAGDGSEGDNLTQVVTLNNNETEFEGAFTIDSAQVSHAATFYLRMVESSGTAYTGGYVTPYITINKPAVKTARVTSSELDLTHTLKTGRVTSSEVDFTHTLKTGRITSSELDLTYTIRTARVTSSELDLTHTEKTGRVTSSEIDLTHTEKTGRVTSSELDLTHTEKTGRVTSSELDLTYTVVPTARVTSSELDLTHTEKTGRVTSSELDLTHTEKTGKITSSELDLTHTEKTVRVTSSELDLTYTTVQSARVTSSELDLTHTEKTGRVTSSELDLTHTEKTARITSSEIDLDHSVLTARITSSELDLTHTEKTGRVTSSELDLTHTEKTGRVTSSELDLTHTLKTARVTSSEIDLDHSVLTARVTSSELDLTYTESPVKARVTSSELDLYYVEWAPDPPPPAWDIIVPMADVSVAWTTAVPPGEHWSTIDEGLDIANPPDDNDFVRSGTNNQIDIYEITDGGSGIKRINQFIWQFRYAGEASPQLPGLTIEFWVAGIKRGEDSFNMLTDGLFNFVEGQAVFPVDISEFDWYTGPRIIKHIVVIPAGPSWHKPNIKEMPID